MIPSLGLINLLERLTELRKPVYSLDYWFITKDIKGYKSTARLKKIIYIYIVWGPKGASVPVELGAQHGCPRKHSGSPTWKLSEPSQKSLWNRIDTQRQTLTFVVKWLRKDSLSVNGTRKTGYPHKEWTWTLGPDYTLSGSKTQMKNKSLRRKQVG